MSYAARKPDPRPNPKKDGGKASAKREREFSWNNSADSPRKRSPQSLPAFAKRVQKKELVNLTSQLAIMTKSGVDVATALQSLVRQCSHPTLKAVLDHVHEDVLAGPAATKSLRR